MKNLLRIAVADDEPDIQGYYRMILAELGHVVVVLAETGRELVEKCSVRHPDLVITEIKMPDMDGIAAAAQICRDRPAPLILVSAYRRAGTRPPTDKLPRCA
jgi:response regulator NasT